MKILSFIRQRSFARYIMFDLADAARKLAWEVELTDEQMDAMTLEQMREVEALWLRAHEVATGVTEH